MVADDANHIFEVASHTKTLPAFARNGFGGDAYGHRSPTVFVTEDEAGKRPIGWFTGEARDGDVWAYSFGTHYRLTVVALADRVAA